MIAGGVHALPPGVDFAAELAAGLRHRLHGAPPQAMARLLVIVNTPLLRTRLTECLAAAGAMLLPRMLTPDELADALLPGALGQTAPALRRRLQLSHLIARLIAAAPDLAPHHRLHDLAESLDRLIDEMQAEGVPPAALAALNVGEHAAHWARMQRFVTLVAEYLSVAGGDADPEARLRSAVALLAARWQAVLPPVGVVMAGSTGSRGNVAALMAAVAALPNGALVLPGFDFAMPDEAWDALGDPATAEDHPQGRHHALLMSLGLGPDKVQPWTHRASADAARNALISLALRPAPVTDRWRAEGAGLGDAQAATARMSLIEAPHPRAEALAIALRLRRAAEDGQRATLVTPDRTLARQVTAALDRWRILPDDSAGLPLNQSPPGRLARMVAALRARQMTIEALLSLLKHPLVLAGEGRGAHLRHTRALELQLRRRGPAFPDAAAVLRWAGRTPEAGAGAWADWLAQVLAALGPEAAGGTDPAPLAWHVARHRAVLDMLAGPGPTPTSTPTSTSTPTPTPAPPPPPPPMWQGEAGLATAAVLSEMAAEAPHAGPMTAAEHSDLLAALLAARSVRDSALAHPLISIRGMREARLHDADLVILGGLVEGVWPEAAPPDPWLSRPMRSAAGLVLPERRIGLAAHDFQQAVAGREVILSRALRDSDAETVPSRWLNRLVCLLEGLQATGGPEALKAMRARGRNWLEVAEALDAPLAEVPRAPRPSPSPPLASRPNALSVTEIQTLIRDPYAIYARHVLGLRPLDPLTPTADFRLRGIVVHRVLEAWVRGRPPEVDEAAEDAQARLLGIAQEVLAEEVPWPSARALWRARLAGAAAGVADFDAQEGGVPVLIERSGVWRLPLAGLRLTGRPDRIDRLPDGSLHIIDYKTGAPPTEKEMRHFDKQLPILALMVTEAAFEQLGRAKVSRASHVRIASPADWHSFAISPDVLSETRAGLERLLAFYGSRGQGYTACRALRNERDLGSYDQLARRGEWDISDAPEVLVVGARDAG